MQKREFYEDIEFKFLKRYAVKSSTAKGRLYPETPDPYRTCFQRDRDRIIHSKAFRRLKHKTQVFISTESDHYRTRLSHTLEVAQIARHMARMLGINEDLSEAIALAHDLGHTPFGHTGEKALDEMLKEHGGFDHNLQSKRVVEKLEDKYPDFPGLNLTQEVLEGLMKHFTPYDHPVNIKLEDLVHPSLEAQVVNLADQLAYLSHDLDDGMSAGILKIDELQKECELVAEIQDKNKLNYGEIAPKREQFMLVRNLINDMILQTVENSERNITEENILSLEDVYASKDLIVNFDSFYKFKIDALQRYLFKFFYLHPSIIKMSEKGTMIIKQLFEYYLENSNSLTAEDNHKIKLGENKYRVIADRISLMTDSYVMKEYQQLFPKCPPQLFEPFLSV